MTDADGLETVTLAKPWRDQAVGETARVDPERAEWMRENGFATKREEPLPLSKTPETEVKLPPRKTEKKPPLILPDLKIPTQD